MASSISNLGRVLARQVALRRHGEVFAISRLCSRNFHRNNRQFDSMKIEMPSLSPTMTEGTIVKWHKKEGDKISPGDILCDIQTDKAVVGMDIDEEGILAKIIKSDNSENVVVGTLIAMIVEEGDDWQNVEVPAESSSDSAPTGPVSTESPVSSSSQSSSKDTGQYTGPIGPSVRKLMDEYDIYLSSIPGTGPHGRITKGDVLSYIKANNVSKKEIKVEKTSPVTSGSKESKSESSSPVPSPEDAEEVEYQDLELTNMRKTIAKRLTESKSSIPHSYISIECDLGPVTALRQSILAKGVKVSMNDFIIKASAVALQRVPKVNSIWKSDSVQMLPEVDISVAVATAQGLITPIVKNAAGLSVENISRTVKDLAGRARDNKLQLNEFQGGSFTISNLGMFGISEFTAVINPPQVAIMAVGGSRLVLGPDNKPQTRMTVCMSYDSRALDETEASQFLEAFQGVLESPEVLAVGTAKTRLSLDDL